MQWRNTTSRYGVVPVWLHWIIVVGIIAQYLLAEASEDREDAAAGTIDLMSIHGAVGVTLLVLALLRLAWRLIEVPPPWPAQMKSYEIFVARAVHWAFYALLFAIPLSGWALTTAQGEPLSYFGLFDLPALNIAGSLTEEQLEELHEVLFNVLVGLAILHIAAALKHQFFDRDDVLRRMLPGRNQRSSQ